MKLGKMLILAGLLFTLATTLIAGGSEPAPDPTGQASQNGQYQPLPPNPVPQTGQTLPYPTGQNSQCGQGQSNQCPTGQVSQGAPCPQQPWNTLSSRKGPPCPGKKWINPQTIPGNTAAYPQNSTAYPSNGTTYPGNTTAYPVNPATVRPNGFFINPNDQVVVTLLTMIISDLNMVRCSLNPRDYLKNALVIGHVNNAQSALRRTTLDPAYQPLIIEIDDRLSKIKFYILLNDFNNVQMRATQLAVMLSSLLKTQQINSGSSVAGSNGTMYYNPGYQNNQGSFYPQNLPPREISVGKGQITPTGFFPTGVPVN
ncbi:MAG: hypothetical protein HQM08_14840 [Candidatus Riflebacteria bacterium]|nr:hypothetical protein [Candidatus Riflebacteria bacterium]